MTFETRRAHVQARTSVQECIVVAKRAIPRRGCSVDAFKRRQRQLRRVQRLAPETAVLFIVASNCEWPPEMIRVWQRSRGSCCSRQRECRCVSPDPAIPGAVRGPGCAAAAIQVAGTACVWGRTRFENGGSVGIQVPAAQVSDVAEASAHQNTLGLLGQVSSVAMNADWPIHVPSKQDACTATRASMCSVQRQDVCNAVVYGRAWEVDGAWRVLCGIVFGFAHIND